MSDINTLSRGTNQGALRIISKRVEENVARAILRDLREEGIITVWEQDWDRATDLVSAIKLAIKTDD